MADLGLAPSDRRVSGPGAVARIDLPDEPGRRGGTDLATSPGVDDPGALALGQAVSWALLVLLARRSPGVSLTIGLAIVIGGSAITIMLSGYATGGQAGLPLSAAILGTRPWR